MSLLAIVNFLPDMNLQFSRSCLFSKGACYIKLLLSILLTPAPLRSFTQYYILVHWPLSSTLNLSFGLKSWAALYKELLSFGLSALGNTQPLIKTVFRELNL